MKKAAIKIVKTLQEKGHTAYFAGGYVRDMLLGHESPDIDIVSTARPEEIEKIFAKTVPIGKRFGIILVILGGEKFEVATFREEGEYLDNRRPSKVTFSDAKSDALRRDFTVNGLFFDPVKNNIIDYVGGRDDIKKKTIRFIGNPNERINEDRLRLIRAIRLKISLGFQYSPDTFDAVRSNAGLIKGVSAERIRDELNKIMGSKNRHLGLVELSEAAILSNIIPELELLKGVPQPIEYHHEGDVFTHTYLAIKSLDERTPTYLAWAVLLHDIGKPQTLTHIKGKIVFHNHAQKSAEIARQILSRLKFTRFEINDIAWLIENHMKIGVVDKMRPTKRLEFVLDPRFGDLIKLVRADSIGTYPVNLALVEKLENDVKKALEWKEKSKLHKKSIILTGDDLIKLGLSPGKAFQEILEDVNDEKIKGVIKTREEAILYVKEKYKNV